MVIYELITGQLPYWKYNNKDQILFMVGRGSLRPDANHARSDTPPQFKRLLTESCKFSRDERPRFPQVSFKAPTSENPKGNIRMTYDTHGCQNALLFIISSGAHSNGAILAASAVRR